jgi:predicted pyridoxine 5'-phosphate oxidase superfamily flavin-nucleotide-binding protein
MSVRDHEGERRVQRRAGVLEKAERVAAQIIRSDVPPIAAGFLAEQVMIVVAHRDPAGAVWASALSGPAGFARALDERTVRIDALPVEGDALGPSLRGGPIALGMQAIEPETRRRMRFNGPGEVRGSSLWLRTDEVYSNCSKYISTRRHVAPVAALARRGAERSSQLSARQRAFVAGADTFFIATSHATTGADASHRGGSPGFVRVDDASHLTWADYKGNSLFMTLGNIELDPHAGLLFCDWDTGDVLQLSGTATIDWDEARAAAFPGGERLVRFAIEQVVVLRGVLGWRWELEEHSRFSPPAPGLTPA